MLLTSYLASLKIKSITSQLTNLLVTNVIWFHKCLHFSTYFFYKLTSLNIFRFLKMSMLNCLYNRCQRIFPDLLDHIWIWQKKKRIRLLEVSFIIINRFTGDDNFTFHPDIRECKFNYYISYTYHVWFNKH